jgi:uncharacterized protein YjeT (DUF2065 family)
MKNLVAVALILVLIAGLIYYCAPQKTKGDITKFYTNKMSH